MPSLTLRAIEKRLGGNQILRGIDLSAADGELVVLVGPSGCGKSTLLRTIAGLELPDAGEVRIGDRDVTRLPPRERDVAMVFQSYALYPHLNVRSNLAFGLKLRGEPREVIEGRVNEVAAMLGLTELLDRYPRQMSGGQRQRVAMGRAIARRPALFLFDEPLSNLDAALRSEVRIEIKRLHSELGATMVYVTHDQVEAMTLADQLVVLRAGVVEQVGPPLDVYEKPASKFVASFMGSPPMNFVQVRAEGGRLRAPGVDLPMPELAEEESAFEAAWVGIRAHDLAVVGDDDAAAQITVPVQVVEAMGFEAYAHGQVADQPFVVRLEADQARTVRAGDSLELTATPGGLRLFDLQTERALALAE